MVGISLFSIVLAFTLPAFNDAVSGNSLNKISRWFITNVRSLKNGAVRDRKMYVLQVDVDAGRLWVTDTVLTDEELEEDDTEPEGYELPGDADILDVEFPGRDKITSGRAQICVHKEGYSDKVLIHVEDDGEQKTFLIEPFLSKMIIYEDYVGFED